MSETRTLEELRKIAVELCDEFHQKQLGTMEVLVILEFIRQAATSKNTDEILAKKAMNINFDEPK